MPVEILHGLSRDGVSRPVPVQSYINTTGLTDGELTLTLMAEQARILAAAYPEKQAVYDKALSLIVDTLHKGLHTGRGGPDIFTGFLDPAFYPVAQAVRKAQSQTRPASGVMTERLNRAGIGDPLIPYEDCVKLFPPDFIEVTTGDQNGDPITSWEDANSGERVLCENQNHWRKQLNLHLEKASHHILYEYVAPNEGTGSVIAKRVLHRGFMDALGADTSISRANLRLWVRNGVMRNNATRKELGPLTPEQTIAAMAENAGQINGTGRPHLGIAPAVIAAIAAIVVAVLGAVTQIILASKAENAQLRAMKNVGAGTLSFGPEFGDWTGYGPPPGSPPGSSPPSTEEENGLMENLPIILAAGAGLLLLISKK